jgi:ABC-2 type transport system permease protein
MLKLLKYNFKESFRLLGPLLITLFVLNMFPDILVGEVNNGWIPAIYGIVNLAILITVFVHLGSSFSKEFNDDRRFLTFTLPIDGKRLILSKLINTSLWLGILWVVFIVDALVVGIRSGNLTFGDFNFEFLNMDLNRIIVASIIFILIALIVYIYIMLSAYFTETLTKLVYRGKGGFIQKLITIILWVIQLKICSDIAEFFADKLPLYYNFVTGDFGIKRATIEMNFNMIQESATVGVNLTAIIMLALISVVYFFGMAYLIDNKVDL